MYTEYSLERSPCCSCLVLLWTKYSKSYITELVHHQKDSNKALTIDDDDDDDDDDAAEVIISPRAQRQSGKIHLQRPIWYTKNSKTDPG
jgi:hypothetical protein